MAEYKSRRERRHAQGGKVHGAGHPTAHKGPVLVIGLIKKKKDGGHVEGGCAKSHLGKRARGGRTEDTEHKMLNAREAAFDSDGIDKEAVGSGKDEREVPVEKRRRGGRADGGAADDDKAVVPILRGIPAIDESKYDANRDRTPIIGRSIIQDGGGGRFKRPLTSGGYADGGATKSKYEVDDDSSKDMGDLDTPKRGSKNEYTTDDDDSEKRAKGGWIGPARERMERKGTVGSLHSALHVPQGEKIPEKKLDSAAKHASGKLAKKIQFAENVRK